MKFKALFVISLILQTSITQSAGSNNKSAKKSHLQKPLQPAERVFTDWFKKIPTGTPLSRFVSDLENFEKELGPEKSDLSYKERKLRFDFLKQLKTGRPVVRANALSLATVSFLPVSTSLIVSSGTNLEMPIFGLLQGQTITPLCFAVSKAPLPFVKKLLALGAEVNYAGSSGETPLYTAVGYRNTKTVKLLLKHGADPNIARKAEHGGTTPIYAAAELGLTEIINLLVKHGADPNFTSAKGVTALSKAAQGEHNDAIKALINGGADIHRHNQDGSTAVFMAASRGHATTVKLLLEEGINPDFKTKKGLSALFIASSIPNNTEVLKELMLHNADVNVQDEDGNTPLLLAVSKENIANVSTLLNPEFNRCQFFSKHGEPSAHRALNIPNNNGITPLFAAACKGNKEIFEMLLNAGASLMSIMEFADGKRKSLLTFLAKSSCCDLSDILECCKDLDSDDCKILSVQGFNGNYPIHDAALRKNPDVLQFLLKRGVNRLLRNNDNKLAYDLAVEAGNKKAIQILRNAV